MFRSIAVVAIACIFMATAEKAVLRAKEKEGAQGGPKCANEGVQRKLPNHIRRNGETTLANLIELASLTSVLNGDGPFTVFAPSNEAFMHSGLLSDLTITPEQLTHTLLYHVVPGNIMSSALIELLQGGEQEVDTAAGAKISVKLVNGKVTINGYAIVETVDLKACNGVIHVIDHVLIPPCGAAGSLPTIADRTLLPIFSTLRSLVLQRSTIATGLSTDGAYTVFAPINNAFADIAAVVSTLSFDQITNVLLDHAIAARYLASDLPLDTTTQPETLLGQTLDVLRTASGVTVAGEGNTSPANVIVANVQACNGVIHALDKVLIPDLS